MTDFVVAIIATYGRPLEISRLLKSLGEIKEGLGAVVVVDNANEPGIRTIVENAPCNAHYFSPGMNLGCGGGIELGEKKALEIFQDRLTHIWILDDDAVCSPDALELLLKAMKTENASLAVPMILDESNRIGWPSGLLDGDKFRTLLEKTTQADFLKRHGSSPLSLSWTQGISVLVTRSVLEELGFHRTDFWLRGEDFEFALRITNQYRGIFVPTVAIQHLIPSTKLISKFDEMEYRKQCALVQNVTYIGLYLEHGKRIRRTIPGRFYYHFKNWGISLKTVSDAFRIFWQGAVTRKPAGHPSLKWPMPRP